LGWQLEVEGQLEGLEVVEQVQLQAGQEVAKEEVVVKVEVGQEEVERVVEVEVGAGLQVHGQLPSV
jgi:hypothetical protein